MIIHNHEWLTNTEMWLDLDRKYSVDGWEMEDFLSTTTESENGYEVFPLASLFTSLPFGPLIESFACKRQEMVIASALTQL